MERAVTRSGLDTSQIDAMLSGDLLNQLMSSSFTARDMHIPFLGLYGACSTMTESLLLGCMLIDGGVAKNVLVGASSHICTAERQFRMPVEHGNQRPPSAQWTATAAGAAVISCKDSLDPRKKTIIRAESATIGKVIDAGIKDANQMGAAMVPAAVDTLLNHLEDTKRSIEYYDLVATGDLGFIGKDIMMDLLGDAGLPKKEVFEYMREEADADVRPACLRDTCFSRWNRERLKNFCSCLQEHCSRRFLLFREKAYRVSPMRFLWRWNRWNIYGHF